MSVEGAVSEGVTAACTPIEQLMFGGSGGEELKSISTTGDGGFVVAGSSTSVNLTDAFPPPLIDNGESNAYIAKFDSGGALAWQRIHGTVNDDSAEAVRQTSDGGYLVVGTWEVVAGDGEDFYVLKLSATGNNEWNRAPGGSGYDKAMDFAEASDGGFIVGGYSYSSDIAGLSYSANGDCYIVKLDATGTTVWQTMFGGTGGDGIAAVERTADDGCIVVGSSYSPDLEGSSGDGLNDFFMARLDSAGTVSWYSVFGGSSYEVLTDIAPTADGGFVICGYSQSGDMPGLTHPYPVEDGQMFRPAAAYLAKLDAAGNVVWETLVAAPPAAAVTEASDGGFVLGGSNEGQYAIFRTDASGVLEWYRECGGSGAETLSALAESADGLFAFAGASDSTDIAGADNYGGNDCYLLIIE